MLYIRTDGNKDIGTGHVMRCLAIARAAKSCTFITADHQMSALMEEQGFPVLCLDTVWNDLDKETGIMEALIVQKHIETLLIDSYFVTPDYLERLCKLTYVAYIDDLNAFRYPCHTLINYNIYATQCDYPSRYPFPEVELLLGPAYAPLREEFLHLPPRSIREQAQAVLVTTGGTDPDNIAGQVVQLAKQVPTTAGMEFHIIVGRFNQNLPMLEQLAETCPGVVLHQNVQRMAGLMFSCDIAISASGSTLYELCACGLPTICFAYADNQLSAAATFGKIDMIYAGDVRVKQAEVIERIVDAVSNLKMNDTFRKSRSRRLRGLVDGGGARRIAERLIKKDFYV